MIALYSLFRLLLSVLLVLTRLSLWRANARRTKAVCAELDSDSTMLESMHAEHARKVCDRRIAKYERRVLGLTALRARVTNLKGRSVPYLIGSVDSSLVWLADHLGYVQPLVDSVRSWF